MPAPPPLSEPAIVNARAGAAIALPSDSSYRAMRVAAKVAVRRRSHRAHTVPSRGRRGRCASGVFGAVRYREGDHMNASTVAQQQQTLDQAVRRLVEAFHPERIYLFGSRARGDARPDSDYDLMVILPDDAPAALRQAGIASAALRDIPAEVNALVWDADRFNRRLHLRASLPATVIREGKLLYDHDPERAAEVREWLRK